MNCYFFMIYEVELESITFHFSTFEYEKVIHVDICVKFRYAFSAMI